MPKSSVEDLFVSVRTEVKQAVIRLVGGYNIIIMPKSSVEDLFVSVRTDVKQAVIRSVSGYSILCQSLQ